MATGVDNRHGQRCVSYGHDATSQASCACRELLCVKCRAASRKCRSGMRIGVTEAEYVRVA